MVLCLCTALVRIGVSMIDAGEVQVISYLRLMLFVFFQFSLAVESYEYAFSPALLVVSSSVPHIGRLNDHWSCMCHFILRSQFFR